MFRVFLTNLFLSNSARNHAQSPVKSKIEIVHGRISIFNRKCISSAWTSLHFIDQLNSMKSTYHPSIWELRQTVCFPSVRFQREVHSLGYRCQRPRPVVSFGSKGTESPIVANWRLLAIYWLHWPSSQEHTALHPLITSSFFDYSSSLLYFYTVYHRTHKICSWADPDR